MERQLERSLGELVEVFAHHTVAQTEAIWRGDSKTGNRHARQRVAAFKQLRAHGDAGRDALAVLLAHPNVDVRTMAAAYLLRHRTQEAVAVLEQAAKGEGLIAFEAQQCLLRWKEGDWALDIE